MEAAEGVGAAVTTFLTEVRAPASDRGTA
jgi:hypothetical protein